MNHWVLVMSQATRDTSPFWQFGLKHVLRVKDVEGDSLSMPKLRCCFQIAPSMGSSHTIFLGSLPTLGEKRVVHVLHNWELSSVDLEPQNPRSITKHGTFNLQYLQKFVAQIRARQLEFHTTIWHVSKKPCISILKTKARCSLFRFDSIHPNSCRILLQTNMSKWVLTLSNRRFFCQKFDANINLFKRLTHRTSGWWKRKKTTPRSMR